MIETVEVDGIDLLRSIANGNARAFDQFYAQYKNIVYRFAIARLNDAQQASDILAEVMVEVWKSASRFEERSKLTTWLLGIAHHKVLDQYRRNGRQKTEELDDNLVDESDSSDLELLINRSREAKLVILALNKLHETHREVLHLLFYQDLNYQEMAEILSVPEGTVKSRVFYAKAELKKALKSDLS